MPHPYRPLAAAPAASPASPVRSPAPLVCIVLCLLLVVFLQSNRSSDDPQTAFSDTQLAALEPASGGESPPAEGGHAAPKPASGGKDLKGPEHLPEVTIGGEAVINSATLRKNELMYMAPEGIMQQAEAGLLERTINVKPFAHNPRRGPSDPSLTVLEFTDLGCPTCMPFMAEVDTTLANHVSDTLFISIHAPLGTSNETNLAAFYGKVAQRQNLYWEYRSRLIKLGKAAPDDYFGALIDSGADRLAVRRMMINEARRFYRELDADAKLAKSLTFTAPPVYLADGITLRTEGSLTHKNLADVLTYQMKALVLRANTGL